MTPEILKDLQIETAIAPKNITGAAQEGDWVNLRHFGKLLICLLQGAWAGGTPAVTLEQAKDVAGTDAKELAFTKRKSKVGLASNTFAEATVASNTFNLPATANTMTVIEVDSEQLDGAGGFGCVRVKVASPGAQDDLLSAHYLLGNARFAGDPMPAGTV